MMAVRMEVFRGSEEGGGGNGGGDGGDEDGDVKRW